MAEELLLSGAWAGLDRVTAPHLLAPGKSPDTTDAAFSSDKQGLLGPRGGRSKATNNAYSLLGVIPYNLPWESGRILATAEGRWTPEVGAVGTPGLVGSGSGWDLVKIGTSSAYIVARSGVGTTNGTALAISSALSMANYGALAYGDPTVDSSVPINIVYGGGFSTGSVTIQGRIATVWTDLYQILIDATTGTVDAIALLVNPGTGSFDQVRAVATISGGGGTLTATFNDFVIWLMRGALNTSHTTA